MYTKAHGSGQTEYTVYHLKQKATESQDKVINLKHQVGQLKKTEQKSISNNKVLQKYNLLAIATKVISNPTGQCQSLPPRFTASRNPEYQGSKQRPELLINYINANLS